MNETAAPKVPKHRSPSYPAYDLETVLTRAKELHKLAGTHPANVSTVIRTWNYSVKSSKGLLMIAAIKKFKLAEDQGKGDARVLVLTQLGRELVHFDSDRTTDQWKERAQNAALTPEIHRELWRRYNGRLPPDSVLKDYMVLERGFSSSAADEVIAEFRRTLDFAGINDTDGATIVLPSEGEHDEEQNHSMTATAVQVPAQAAAVAPARTATPPRPATPTPVTPMQRGSASAPLPVNVNLSDDGWAILQVSDRLSEAQWDQLMAVLNAMKPGLTS